MKNYKYFRIILILIPVAILGVLIYKDFNPRGYLKATYNFCYEDPFITKFSPHGRVLEIQQNNNVCTQQMVIDPVYFDVRLPQKFTAARLKIWYQKDSSTELKIGPAIDLVNWQWQLKDITYMQTVNNWQLGVADYDLTYLKMDKNNLRWLISSPNLDTNQQHIIFDKIEIEFFKEPLNKNNVWQRVKEWLYFTII